ncbi:MAG: translation initiation factor, partial [Actinomycetota bacterium]
MGLAKNMRVHELAKELGMTNTEVLGLCSAMGVEAKSQSSSIIEAQADRLRRRAERDGLTRPEQPEEAKPVKKGAAKKATAAKQAVAAPEASAPAEAPAAPAAPAAPVVEAPAVAPAPAP